jgi:hypothetical protein
MGALLRVRAGAEGARKAADGCCQGCAPGRYAGPSGPPSRGGGKGRGLLGHRYGLGLNTSLTYHNACVITILVMLRNSVTAGDSLLRGL